VAAALAADNGKEEDASGSCSFRQLRGEMLPLSQASNVPGEAEEAWMEVGAEERPHHNVATLEVEYVTNASQLESSGYVPMITYPKSYCHTCGEMAFCHRAGNPGCGGSARGGVSSFANSQRGSGCGGVRPTLTIPRSFIKHIGQLRKYSGGTRLLGSMLVSGFNSYTRHGGRPPFWQCIHKSGSVSVRWLHLHTFCKSGHVDSLPNRGALCALMSSPSQAGSVAMKLMR